MRDIRFSCPACGQQLTVDASGSGRAVACPACAQPVVIPGVASPERPPAEAEKHASGSRSGWLWGGIAVATTLALGWITFDHARAARNAGRRGGGLPSTAVGAPSASTPVADSTADAPSEQAPRHFRVVRFPATPGLGGLFLEPPAGPGWEPKSVTLAPPTERWGMAQGEVNVPAEARLQLVVPLNLEARQAAVLRARNPTKYLFTAGCRTRPGPEDLSGLAGLGPNDLYRLTVSALMPLPDADARVAEPIARLVGLAMLNLYETGLTDKGLESLRPLRSLRVLELAEPAIRGPGLEALAELPALEYLDLVNEVGDTALRHVGSIASLRWLRLRTGRIDGPGLAELARLPRLERLCLWGQGPVSDRHLRYLEGLPCLRSLTVWGNDCQAFTDAAMASIGKLASLEELYFVRASPRITPAGVARLSGLTDLQAVDFDSAWGGPEGVRYGDTLARTLAGNHPNLRTARGVGAVSADGMAALAALPKLKSLGVHLRGRHQAYRDPTGLAHLAKATGLEELTVFTEDALRDTDYASLEPLRQLRSLSLAGQAVSEAGMDSLAKLASLECLTIGGASRAGLNRLNRLTGLTNLDVSAGGIPIPPGHGEASRLDWPSLKNLRSLSLRGLELEEKDFETFARLRRLEQLQISVGPLGGACLRPLARLPELRTLYVCRLSSCTSEELACLNDAPKLSEMTLVGAVGVDALTVLTGPPRLNSLTLQTSEPIPYPARAEWIARHPALEYLRVESVPMFVK